MLDNFVVQGGSVIGSHHHKNFKNNQDAWHIETTEHSIIGLVGDGCGSGQYSEVGAQLGVRFMANYLQNLSQGWANELPCDWEYFLNDAVKQFLFKLQSFNQFCGLCEKDVYNYWLFTILGFVVTEKTTVVFSFGDGLVSLNNNVEEIDQNNEPHYLSYGTSKVKIHHLVSTDDVQSLWIATDGLAELLEKSDQEISLLGKEWKVKELVDFEQGEKYLVNKSLVQKRLNVFGHNHKLLYDDSTVILLRRKGE